MIMTMMIMMTNGRWSAAGFGAAAAGDPGKLGANEPIVVQSC